MKHATANSFLLQTVGASLSLFVACQTAGHPNDEPNDAGTRGQPHGLVNHSPIITTIAGTSQGIDGYVNGSGQVAQFRFPEGMALNKDASKLFIIDERNDAIRQIDLASNQVSTVAGALPANGNGTSGVEDGVGTSARLNNPRSVVVDAARENLYFTDTGNFAIRKFNIATQMVTTIAGGKPGSSDGTGTAAQFSNVDANNQPGLWAGGLALDESDPAHTVLYIADSANETLRQMDLATTEVTTIAGQVGVRGSVDGPAAQALFNKPNQLILDGQGHLLIGESDNPDIRRLDLATLNVETVAGLAPPQPDLVCDDANPNFRPGVPPQEFEPANCDSTDGPGNVARFRFPFGMALNADRTKVFIVDAHNDEVREMTIDGSDFTVTTIAGVLQIEVKDDPHPSHDTVVAANGSVTTPGTFAHPADVVFVQPNILYISDRSARSIRKVVLGQ